MSTAQSSVIRPVFFALLLANVVFFAWVQQAPPGEDDREPARMAAQLAADKVNVITLAATVVQIPAIEPVPAAAELPIVQPVPAVTAETCRIYHPVFAGAARALQAELAQLSSPLKVVLPQGKEASFWVFIPSLLNQAAAEKKLGELQKLGVEDAFLMQERGPQQFAISLGLFKSEELAAKYLASLTKRGVRSAKMMARERSEAEEQEKLSIEISGNSVAVSRTEKEHKALTGVTASDCKAP